MAEAKITKLVDQIGELTVLELSELVSAIEEKFDVEASAPMMVAAGGAAANGEAAPAAEEQDAFDVVLNDFGAKKIQVIKVVRELTGLGLKEAKDLVEGIPGKVLEGVDKAAAEDAKTKLEAEGAKIEIK